MAAKFKVQKFRTNDLSNSYGKQFELGKSWCEDFLEIPKTANEVVINLVFKPITEAQLPFKDRSIELNLSSPTGRADRKAYADGDNSHSQIKEFFLNTLRLNESNKDDYFAFYKSNDGKWFLYVVPKMMYENFVKLFTEDTVFDSKETNDKDTNILEEKKTFALQQIYYGAPGTGKSHIINTTVCGESVIRTTFHPDSDYSTFVGCYKPTTKTVKMRDMAGHVIRENGEDVTEDRIVYEFVDQAFLQAYTNAWKFYDSKNEEIKNQFLVIEEINRGNCAQIFGDLFQLLDRNAYGFSDYPIQADNDMRKQLAKAFNGITISEENKNRINACYKGNEDYVSQVLNGEILLLPDNFYIWATMNTSDQSLFPIDSAFKRRWDWQYMPIAKGRENGKELNWRIEADTNQYDWWSFLTKINEQIGSTTNSEDKKLGFFFCKAKNEVINAETFVGKVIFYLWNDVFKDFGFEGTIFNDEDGSTLSFDKFYSNDNNGKVVVNNDKVQRFLDNLNVEVVSVQDNLLEDDFLEENLEDTVDDDEEDNASQKKRDNSRYSINGNGNFRKRNLAEECVKLYIANNPEIPTSQIVDNWMSLNIKVPYLIETEEDFERREKEGNDTHFRSRAIKISLNNEDNIYVTNQFNVERTQDFIEKVNATNWGIKVEKVE